jgi:hypothetical protein
MSFVLVAARRVYVYGWPRSLLFHTRLLCVPKLYVFVYVKHKWSLGFSFLRWWYSSCICGSRAGCYLTRTNLVATHARERRIPMVYKMEDGTKDTGLINYKPKPGGRSRKNLIGPLKKGLMTKMGYSVSAKAKTRRRAVDRAVKKYGKLSTLRKLNAVAVYTRRTSPVKSRKFKSDVKYVQKKYY